MECYWPEDFSPSLSVWQRGYSPNGGLASTKHPHVRQICFWIASLKKSPLRRVSEILWRGIEFLQYAFETFGNLLTALIHSSGWYPHCSNDRLGEKSLQKLHLPVAQQSIPCRHALRSKYKSLLCIISAKLWCSPSPSIPAQRCTITMGGMARVRVPDNYRGNSENNYGTWNSLDVIEMPLWVPWRSWIAQLPIAGLWWLQHAPLVAGEWYLTGETDVTWPTLKIP